MININATNDKANGFSTAILTQENSSHLSAALAHDVRNPLATAKLAAEFLIQNSTNDIQRRYLGMIMHSACQINEVIRKTLTTFEPKINIIKEYALHQLLEEVLEANANLIFLSNVVIEKNFTSHAPAVEVDEKEIKIALGNIIINAIEASPKDGGMITITTIYDYSTSTVIIEDNGKGMNKETLKNIFKPLYTTRPDGVGLGLYLTKAILDANKVSVKVYSEEHAGTQFVLSFGNERTVENIASL